MLIVLVTEVLRVIWTEDTSFNLVGIKAMSAKAKDCREKTGKSSWCTITNLMCLRLSQLRGYEAQLQWVRSGRIERKLSAGQWQWTEAVGEHWRTFNQTTWAARQKITVMRFTAIKALTIAWAASSVNGEVSSIPVTKVPMLAIILVNPATTVWRGDSVHIDSEDKLQWP